MKKYKLLLITLSLMFCSINVSANETSEYSVTYENEVEKDSTKDCEVLISIPYTYSEEIPKQVEKTIETTKDVQTGDESNISLYTLLSLFSILGIGFSLKKIKTIKNI